MKTPVWIWVQRLLPQRLLCAFIYRVSRSERRWLSRPLIAWFARHYRIDIGEAANPDLTTYASFNAFFTRALRPGARTIATAARTLVSPVDGTLTEFGRIEAGQLVQAKGLHYGAAELLGETEAALGDLAQGAFATIYLAPYNYHRIHTPYEARLVAMRYLPGTRFSVNALTTSHIERLFCRNERLVCWFESDFGRYAAVLVGALNVSSISTRVTGEIASGRTFAWQPPSDGVDYARGEEFATFNLGSTVILVLPPAGVEWLATVHKGLTVRLGDALAVAAASAR
jgi:phosphatidylserine decarboxylase